MVRVTVNAWARVRAGARVIVRVRVMFRVRPGAKSSASVSVMLG